MKSLWRHGLPAALAVCVLAGTVSASLIGTDNAAQAIYNDNWITGDDGAVSGDAFGPWTLATNTSGGGFAGHFIGDSTVLSAPGANINSSGESFGMYGGSGGGFGQADAFRSFNGGGLATGQTFSIDLAVNFRNGYKGIDIRNASDVVLFNLNVNNPGGGDDYTVFAATGSGSLGSTYSNNTAFQIALTQTSAGGGTWSVTRSGGVSDFDSGTYTGVPTNIKLYVGQTGGGDPNNLYANNLSIVPEPASCLLFGMGALLFARARRKARRYFVPFGMATSPQADS